MSSPLNLFSFKHLPSSFLNRVYEDTTVTFRSMKLTLQTNLVVRLFLHWTHRHILRDLRPSTTACPVCWAMGDKRTETVYGEVKKYFVCWPTRAATAEQIYLVPTRPAQRNNQGRTPFISTLWVPICLSFNSQQGPPLFSLSGRTCRSSHAFITHISSGFVSLFQF